MNLVVINVFWNREEVIYLVVVGFIVYHALVSKKKKKKDDITPSLRIEIRCRKIRLI